MAVEVIDKIKPKNGGSFPVVEAVDVEVSEGLRLPDALAAKANTADVTSATSNLQSQIDQIAQAAGSGSADTEVAQARVDADGTTYTTLKERLDSNEADLKDNINEFKSSIYNYDNLLLSAKIVKNKYYVEHETDSQTLSYAVVPMTTDKIYVLSKARFIAYETGNAVETFTDDDFEFTPESNQDVYITFWNDQEWYVYEKGKDPSRIGTYQHPCLTDAILSRTTGDNDNIAISQKAVTDAINAPIGIGKITGVTIKDGTDLSPMIIERGSGYYTASAPGGYIEHKDNEDYSYFKLPINGEGLYVFDPNFRFVFTTDVNGAVVETYNNYRTYFLTSTTAKLLWVSYKSSETPTIKVAKSPDISAITLTPSDTVYLLPSNVEEINTSEIESEVNGLQTIRNNTNIFDNCTLVENKGYYSGVWYDYAFLSVLIISVEAGKTYKFGCELRFLSSNSGDIGQFIPEGYEYTPEADEILYCSITNASADNWKAVVLPDDVTLVNGRGKFSFNPDLIAQDIGSSKTLVMSQNAVTKLVGIKDKLYGKGYAQTTGDLSDGDDLTLPKTNVKKNNVYSFMAYITSFTKLLIGHGQSTYESSWIEITDTKLIVHNYLNADATAEYEHGLTLTDYIYVQITVDVGSAVANITSNGIRYTSPAFGWFGDANSNTYVESVESVLTDCVFTWSSEDFRKSIWMFGDSYFGMTNTSRWVKYLIDAGYGDNVLLNAYPGENTAAAIAALNNMIQYYGKPAFLVWCLGMNDGSDTDEDTPSSAWMTGINRVLEICEAYSITPIFATIPTVPNIYHEGKNKYVRDSNYRYIDFAKAVGASGDGTWFDGMLNSDNVHPNAPGAIALYHRAIADCPEITFRNP